MNRILVVDDERHLRMTLEANLKARGYEVELAETGRAALDAISQHPMDLVILDLGLPGISGIDVIHALRPTHRMPILVLSARQADGDKIAALDAGADDYVTKPFSIAELLARVRAALRRAGPTSPHINRVVTDAFCIDLAARRVQRDGKAVRLTPTEWRILEALARSPDCLVSQRQLQRAVWGQVYPNDTNALRVHLTNLRRKLEPIPAQPRYLRTEPGLGYRFTGEIEVERG